MGRNSNNNNKQSETLINTNESNGSESITIKVSDLRLIIQTEVSKLITSLSNDLAVRIDRIDETLLKIDNTTDKLQNEMCTFKVEIKELTKNLNTYKPIQAGTQITSTCSTNTIDVAQQMIKFNLKPSVIHWIKNYLSDRFMQVRIKGSYGRKVSCAASGVPQGSTLGPALFAVYMSGLNTIIMDDNYYVILYADDILLIERVTNNLENHNSKVDLIVDWCNSLDMPINSNKLKQMFIPRARGFITPGIKFENIDVVDSHKYLGIIFNSKFDLSNHIRIALDRASQRLYIIRIIRNILPKKRIIELCNSLVLSRAFYAAPLLYTANKTEQLLFERFVRRCHRVVCDSNCIENCF